MARRKITIEEELFNQSIGKHIETLRQRARLTQRQLAAAIGVKQQTLASIENGSTRCSLFLMAKIARRLGIPVAALTQLTRLSCFPAQGPENRVA